MGPHGLGQARVAREDPVELGVLELFEIQQRVVRSRRSSQQLHSSFTCTASASRFWVF